MTRALRIATLGLHHEANTFSPLLAEWSAFEDDGLVVGDAMLEHFRGSHATAGGFIAAAERLGIDLVPIAYAGVNPVGAITHDAFERIAQIMLGGLGRLGPWDGVLLAWHGAAVAEGYPDADGELLSRIRQALGPLVPVGMVLDLHANVTPQMLEAVTFSVAYRSNPHLDAAERGEECAELLVRTLRREVRPVQAHVHLPVAPNIIRCATDEEPFHSFEAAARAAECRNHLLSLSVFQGFPYADVGDIGMSVVAVADDDLAAARQAAGDIAAEIWRRRAETQGTAPDAEQAIASIGPLHPDGALVLLDVGDNIGGGAPGDSTVLLHAARRHRRALCQTLWDAEAVRACAAAGEGGLVELLVGARHQHSPGTPFPVRGRIGVVRDGHFEEREPRHGGFRYFDAGPVARLESEDGHVLVLTSKQIGNSSLELLHLAGVNPRQQPVMVAKGVNAPRAAYAPIASALQLVDTPGITTMRLESLRYHHRPTPLYPFELDAEWQ